MASFKSLEYLQAKHQDFYCKKKYVDVNLSVFEQNSDDGKTLFTVINSHAFVLDVNSLYFEQMLTQRHCGECIDIEVVVNKGEGRLMEILISSFYNKDILEPLTVDDMLSILELGSIYANEEFVGFILKMIEKIDLDYVLCNTILSKVHDLEQNSKLDHKLFTEMKKRCASFLGKYFAPLELKQTEITNFRNLDYAALSALIHSDEIFSWSENSVMTYVIDWIDYDLLRQTENIIESLLKCLRVKFLTGEYLYNSNIYDHAALNKWSGYKRFLFDSIGFLSLSASDQSVQYPLLEKQVLRNMKNGILSWYMDPTSKTEMPVAIRWLVYMTAEEKGKRFGPTQHLCVHDGFKFSPYAVNIECVMEEPNMYHLSVSISCSGSLTGVRFVIGVLPADRDYDIKTKMFYSCFAQTFLTWTSSMNFCNDILTLNLWSVSKDFVDVINEHGLYVSLLPVTEREYTYFATCSAYHACNGYVVKYPVNILVSCARCGRVPLSTSAKIHLTATMNYSM